MEQKYMQRILIAKRNTNGLQLQVHEGVLKVAGGGGLVNADENDNNTAYFTHLKADTILLM